MPQGGLRDFSSGRQKHEFCLERAPLGNKRAAAKAVRREAEFSTNGFYGALRPEKVTAHPLTR